MKFYLKAGGSKECRFSNSSRQVVIASAATVFRNVPRWSISTSTASPGLSQTGGFRAMPTPGGVPVKIRSPGSRVKTCDRYAISSSTPKISWLVLESCIVWPLSRRRMPSLWGSGISSGVTSTGPDGRERVEGLAGHPLLAGLVELPVASRDVVPDRVAADMLERPLARDVPPAPADHDDQLCLVVDLLADSGQDNRLAVANQGGRVLAEENRLAGTGTPLSAA